MQTVVFWVPLLGWMGMAGTAQTFGKHSLANILDSTFGVSRSGKGSKGAGETTSSKGALDKLAGTTHHRFGKNSLAGRTLSDAPDSVFPIGGPDTGISWVPTDAMGVVNVDQAPVGYGYGVMEAEGKAQVSVGIDVSVIMERLSILPQILEASNNVLHRLDAITIAADLEGLMAQISSFQQTFVVNLEQQSFKVNELANMVGSLLNNQESIIAQLSQMLATLGSISLGPDPTCRDGLLVIQNMVQDVMPSINTIIQLVQSEERIAILPPEHVNLLQTIYQSVQQTSVSTENIGGLIQQSSGAVMQSCNRPAGSSVESVQILEQIAVLSDVIQRVPQIVLESVQKGSTYGGPSLANIMEMIQIISSQVEASKTTLSQMGSRFVSLLLEQQNHLVAVKKVVSSELVQANAALATAQLRMPFAGRSLKCPPVPLDSTAKLDKKLKTSKLEGEGNGKDDDSWFSEFKLKT